MSITFLSAHVWPVSNCPCLSSSVMINIHIEFCRFVPSDIFCGGRNFKMLLLDHPNRIYPDTFTPSSGLREEWAPECTVFARFIRPKKMKTGDKLTLKNTEWSLPVEWISHLGWTGFLCFVRLQCIREGCQTYHIVHLSEGSWNVCNVF